MKTHTYKITGIRPLLHANNQAADPLGEYWEKLSAIRKKRVKVKEDYQQMDNLMWYASIYHDEELGPFIPSLNIMQMLVDSAGAFRLKPTIKAAVLVEAPLGFPVHYKGPRELAKLAADPQFRLRRLVPNRKANSVSPTVNAMFPTGWTCEFTVMFDETLIEGKDLTKVVERAGSFTAVGGWRPMFGRFTPKLIK